MPICRHYLAAILLACAGPGLAGAQPTFERSACLHPYDQPLGGVNLTVAAADWDDDGRFDLAYGAPRNDFPNSGQVDHGVFHVYELESLNPSSFGWRDGFSGLAMEQRGYAIAAGDFDGDDLLEFAVSAPLAGGGNVVVREPCGNGCVNQLGIVLAQGVSDISGSSEVGDNFGSALAAGDFDNDGYDDLAVGVPGESWPGADGTKQGAVHVFYGSVSGLDGARDLVFGQDSFSGQTREDGDQFGQSLAAGDLDGDGYADLAIGVPHENESAVVDSGIVHVVFGGASGLDFTRRQNWSQSTSGIASSPETDDLFGSALAIGDFDRATLIPIRRDLAISAGCEADGAIACAGAVHVLYSDAAGPSATGSIFLLRPGGSAENAAFGANLLAMRLDTDSVTDLAVGSAGPAYPTPDGFTASGEVHLLYGRKNGAMRDSGLPPLRPLQGACFAAGVAANKFGSSLAAGDFDDDGAIDLAVAIPGWSHSVQDTYLGAVEILFGKDSLFSDGFETGDGERWSTTAP